MPVVPILQSQESWGTDEAMAADEIVKSGGASVSLNQLITPPPANPAVPHLREGYRLKPSLMSPCAVARLDSQSTHQRVTVSCDNEQVTLMQILTPRVFHQTKGSTHSVCESHL